MLKRTRVFIYVVLLCLFVFFSCHRNACPLRFGNTENISSTDEPNK
jgi:hypothetical protein